MPNRNKWHNRFMEMAELVAGWSKDPSTKVGCVLVDQRRNVLAVGYNGFPRGASDDARLSDRSTKYMLVQHAEINAIINAARELSGVTAYVTHSPCASCTGALIQAGVRHIVTKPLPIGLAERFATSLSHASDLRREADVHLRVLADGPAA